MLNDRVLPFYEEQELRLLRILTDRGTEFCGQREHHEYQLYMAIEDIDHTRTKAKSPQTNGICERFHRTIQDEFYAIAFRKKIYTSIEEIQADLDDWLHYYNNERTHSGKHCFGKTPMQTLIDSKHLADEKMLDLQSEKILPLLKAGEAETGSGGDQPVRNILSDDWNGQGALNEPQYQNYSKSQMP